MSRYLCLVLGFTLALRTAAGAPPAVRLDATGESLPPGMVQRLGSSRLQTGSSVYALTFTPDGRRIVSSGDRGPLVWDAADGRPVELLREKPGGIPSQVAVLPDGRLLAAMYTKNG
jgi:WD40 repeat protein